MITPTALIIALCLICLLQPAASFPTSSRDKSSFRLDVPEDRAMQEDVNTPSGGETSARHNGAGSEYPVEPPMHRAAFQYDFFPPHQPDRPLYHLSQQGRERPNSSMPPGLADQTEPNLQFSLQPANFDPMDLDPDRPEHHAPEEMPPPVMNNAPRAADRNPTEELFQELYPHHSPAYIREVLSYVRENFDDMRDMRQRRRGRGQLRPPPPAPPRRAPHDDNGFLPEDFQ